MIPTNSLTHTPASVQIPDPTQPIALGAGEYLELLARTSELLKENSALKQKLVRCLNLLQEMKDRGFIDQAKLNEVR